MKQFRHLDAATRQLLAGAFLVALLLGGLLLFAFRNRDAADLEEVVEPDITATFSCNDGKFIIAGFSEGLVQLALSDNREYTLEQALSASGARYATEDERFVFWNSGNTAFIDEDGERTFDDCVTPVVPEDEVVAVYQNNEYGFAIEYPADAIATTTFSRSYLAVSDWSYGVGPESVGEPVVAAVLPGSNEVLAAEVRIGVSADPAEVLTCTEAPMIARLESVSTTVVNGITYTTYEGGDAAMNHFVNVRGYRTVHDGQCYAIEQLVIGTNPDVYDPPRSLPFTEGEAFDRLEDIARSLRFTEKDIVDFL